jgi:5-methylcytosine-specific restriction endonuclease McrA
VILRQCCHEVSRCKKEVYFIPAPIGNTNGFKKGVPSWNAGVKGGSWTLARREAQAKMVKRTRKPSTYRSRGRKYHPLWVEIRKLIYQRDKWLCQECGVHCHNSEIGKIQCHHIDYDVDNNSLDNLITLCRSCHMKTNYKRVDWINHFQTYGKRDLKWQLQSIR